MGSQTMDGWEAAQPLQATKGGVALFGVSVTCGGKQPINQSRSSKLTGCWANPRDSPVTLWVGFEGKKGGASNA